MDDISRRGFFKGIGTAIAAAVMVTPAGKALASLIPDPRLHAWKLLNESADIFNQHGKCQEYFDKTKELFDLLLEHFPYSEPPSFDVQVAECGDLLRMRGKYEDGITENHWRTCYPATFAIMIVRDGLKHRKLPMIQAPNWRPFAKMYSRVVIAA